MDPAKIFKTVIKTSKGKMRLGRQSKQWDNIKMNLKYGMREN